MKIQDIMTKDVAACRSTDSLNEAARIMWEQDCGCAPVLGSGSKTIGMLTDRDICMTAYFQGKALAELPVSSAMSKKVYSCKPGDDLSAAEEIMESKQVRRLPVINEEGRLVGLISLNDIARMAAVEEVKPGGRRRVNYWGVARTLAAICQRRPAEAHRQFEPNEPVSLLTSF